MKKVKPLIMRGLIIGAIAGLIIGVMFSEFVNTIAIANGPPGVRSSGGTSPLALQLTFWATAIGAIIGTIIGALKDS